MYDLNKILEEIKILSLVDYGSNKQICLQAPKGINDSDLGAGAGERPAAL